jgi:hypothetical protein
MVFMTCSSLEFGVVDSFDRGRPGKVPDLF